MDETDETDETDSYSDSYTNFDIYPIWINIRAFVSLLIIAFLIWHLQLKHLQWRRHLEAGKYIWKNSIIEQFISPHLSVQPTKFVFVTSYYDIGNKSKASSQEYSIWVSNFLKIFVGTLYFYTSDSLALNYTAKARGNVHFVTKYKTVWDIPCVSGLDSVYAKQYDIDPEKYHSPDLYAVWNSKICLMKEISALYPWSLVFWIDSGSVRESIYSNIVFPNLTRMNEVFPNRTTDGRMIFAMRKKLRMERFSPPRLVTYPWAIGGFFGGDHAALLSLHNEFWQMHEKYLRKGFFVGSDQFLFSTYMLYHDNVLVQPNYYAMEKCDSWFATYSFYGNTELCFSIPPELDHVSYYVKY